MASRSSISGITLCTILVAAYFVATTVRAYSENIVSTDRGPVSGISGRDGSVVVFKGIPYAAAPRGDLRWAAPQPAPRWHETLKADHFSDGCQQDFPAGNFGKSEDCLYLNVWTPALSAGAGLPVMVWIHGGGLRVGSASEPLYDGEELAKQGVVIVSLNYRLGIFGFFANPELTKESPHHSSGNYGLLDQLAALQWVRRNIRAFGGDPGKVTIFGQSGGAFAVNSQVATPLSKGLFRAAIAESGGLKMGPFGVAMPSLAEGEKAGASFAASLGAHSLVELRALPVEQLLPGAASAGPIADGWFFPESMSALFKEGPQNRVPMLIGSNSDEAQHMIRSALPAQEFAAQAQREYGNDAERFLALYPSNSNPYAKVSQQLEMADRVASGERELADLVSRSGSKAFLYYFAYQDAGGYNSETPTLGLKLGADHGAELPYVFGLLKHWKSSVPASDLAIQTTVMAYWTNFAKTLDPNAAGLPVWDPYQASDQGIMVVDQSIGMKKHPRSEELEFLKAYPAQ